MLFLTAPSGSAVQPADGLPGMPDLISDRPYIWREQRETNPEDGSLQRVLAFDGYLHNVGEGSLDLMGNPQIPGDVVQRVFDGENWEEIAADAAPTVRYETNDGHNHFHLIGISEYALYDESRRFKVDDSSKIGFCLVDTEQIEEITDAFYDIDRYQYCNQDDPDSTELRMGISPGWRDTYDANTTLQWVDVSNVAPGKYWIGAITDPKNEIAESNEDNNGLTYSLNTFPVAGYAPAEVPEQQITRAATPISLPAHAYGLVGDPSWTIVSGPENGSLDVPINAALNHGRVLYTPDEGFSGEDSFEWHVRDGSRIFPHAPETHTVRLVVPEPVEPAEVAPSVAPNITSVLDLAITIPEYRFVEYEADAEPAGDLRWFGANLPTGLRIDETTGTISGVPTTQGEYESVIFTWDAEENVLSSFQDTVWTIEPEASDQGLREINRQESSVGERVDIFLGKRRKGAAYEATGLPEGAVAVPNIPWVSGTPAEIGTFEIAVSEIVDDEVVATSNFIWVVRPAPIPAFPL